MTAWNVPDESFCAHQVMVAAPALLSESGPSASVPPVDDVLMKPRHPYTSGLLRSLPSLSARRSVLPSIPGRVPSPNAMPAGGRFAPRCSYAAESCQVRQTLVALGPQHAVQCCRAAEISLPGAVN
ncbi:MAG: hypothetical protein J0H25_19460 [Rhizobiales bacterium]|nr:hypothetical protein [Hyphomicrobiales bacterium]